MLNFYINRAGKNLPKQRLERLEAAKDELRASYGRPRQKPERKASRSSKAARTRKIIRKRPASFWSQEGDLANPWGVRGECKNACKYRTRGARGAPRRGVS